MNLFDYKIAFTMFQIATLFLETREENLFWKYFQILVMEQSFEKCLVTYIFVSILIKT